MPRHHLVSLPLLMGAGIAVSAAPISWGPAVSTTGKSQLLEGPVVLAVSGGNGATITGGGAGATSTYNFSGVNYQGLNFTPSPGARTSNDISNGAPSTGDTGFDTIMKSLTDTQSGITSGTQTISGLTAGTQYQVQVFFNDQRSCCNGRTMTYGDGSGNTVNLDALGSGWGEFAVGTFTADGPAQALTHAANGFGNVHVNAILIVQPGPAPPPDIPANLVAVPGNNRVTLNWDDNTQPGFLEFRVKRSATSGGPYTQIGTTGTSTWTDLTAANGIPYYYVVTAANIDLAESAPSDEADATPSPGAAPPNFIFVITDDQDTYSIGAYRTTEPAEPDAAGNPYLVDTPSIDRLAAEGMLFHNAHIMGATGGAVCTFSRTMIMTGRHLWHRTVGSATDTFPGAFNLGGYDTFRTCKNGNSYSLANNEFDTTIDATRRGNTDGNGSEWHADNVLNFLENRATAGDTDPFFIYLGFSHPHDVRNARTSPALTGRYGCINTGSPGSIVLNTAAPPLPSSHLPVNASDGIPANYPFHPFDHGHLNVRDEVNVSGILQDRTEPVVRNEIGRNFACVDWIDRQLGRVLAKLDEQGLAGNTYIVFTSDHGIAIGRHGLQGKQNLYEHTWKVPFIVRGPGIASGSESNALVYLHDVFPTFCDLAGATVTTPSTIGPEDGLSIRPVLEGTATTARDALYGVYRGGSQPGIRSIKNGRWKLIKYDVDGNSVQETQLFDLEENPFELLADHGVPNLATQPSHALIRQELEELLMTKRAEFDDPDAFLGDRTLLRFEDGTAGQDAGVLVDRLPWQNHGTAQSGNGGSLPVFSADVPGPTDFVVGEPNTHSLDFEQGDQDYVEVPDGRSLQFGNNPFTIEAWVKLETMPAGPDAASRMPVAMKRTLVAADTQLDYLFLAAAGDYGGPTNFANLAVVLAGTSVVSILSIPDTGWHHISVAVDPVSDIVRFTMDDQADTQATTATGVANAGPLIIGAQFDPTGSVVSAFDGLLDELSITDGFLALTELQPLLGIPDPPPFRIESISLGEGSGTVELVFESSETWLYDVQHSTNLEDASWTTVRSFLGGAPGAATTTVTGLPLPPGDRSFFRVRCYAPSRP